MYRHSSDHTVSYIDAMSIYSNPRLSQNLPPHSIYSCCCFFHDLSVCQLLQTFFCCDTSTLSRWWSAPLHHSTTRFFLEHYWLSHCNNPFAPMWYVHSHMGLLQMTLCTIYSQNICSTGHYPRFLFMRACYEFLYFISTINITNI